MTNDLLFGVEGTNYLFPLPLFLFIFLLGTHAHLAPYPRDGHISKTKFAEQCTHPQNQQNLGLQPEKGGGELGSK